MRIMPICLLMGILIVSPPGFLSAAWAQSWSETGDAGDLIGTAQSTVGNGGLMSISGFLESPGDADLYCVTVPSEVPGGVLLFGLQCIVDGGPNIWLFDSTGMGVFANMTCTAGGKEIWSPLAPGTYYVGVAFRGIDPMSGPHTIWATSGFGQRAPDGAGAAGPLVGWQYAPVLDPINPYTITTNFDWVGHCDGTVPATPSTWGTLKALYRK